MELKRFEQAVQRVRHGDREQGYRLLRQVLLDDPTYAPAWFWMGRLVDDVGRKRECLERALALDPNYTPACEALESLRIQELLRSARSIVAADSRREPHKLGVYLIRQGLLTKEQLEVALMEQRTRASWGKRGPLGDILVRRGFLTPQALASALLIQQQDKLRSGADQRPERLGEYLTVEGLVAPEQLETALAEQARLRQSGQYVVLGELLIGSGYLTHAELERVLEQQRGDFYSSFD